MLKRRLLGERYLLAPGQVVRGAGPYTIEAALSGGAFSAGYRAADSEGRPRFVKEFLPADRPAEKPEIRRVFEQECDVLRRIGNYELCPRLHDAFETCGFMYLVQDFIAGQDLESMLEARTQLPEESLVCWCLCLCHALAFLHSRNVVHHDLKPANVRINADGDPVLLDFGAARWYRTADEKTDLLYGTEGYLAPEYARQGSEDLGAGMRMDVFALGRILVELLVGERMSQMEIDRRHDQLYGAILHSKTLDIGLVKAVFKSVAYNPEARYSSAIEMEKDLVQSAPPIGRRRPGSLDLGVATDNRPREEIVSVYNVGGGTLSGEVSTDVEWLEVGVAGTATARQQAFQGNRQSVRVIAHPERLPEGARAEGRVIFGFPSGYAATTVHLRRPADLSRVVVHPERIRLAAASGAAATLRFVNRGTGSVTVGLLPPDFGGLSIAPQTFGLHAGGQAEVQVSLAPGVVVPNGPVPLGWTVDGVPRDPVVLEFRHGTGGIMAAVRRGFKRGKQVEGEGSAAD